ELQWKTGVEKIERKMIEYREVVDRSGSPTEKAGAAENVATAMEEAAESHTDPKVKKYLKKKAIKFREAKTDEERDSVLMDIGKGISLLLMTPFALVGAALLAAGMILDGVAKIAKGIGKL
ncbi:hypothetical protein M422DRAFT_82927, partial [Sphaerobolus stellatus SS14]